MDRRPTIMDVAKRAGVSKSTVSLVLNRSPSVRKQTREQVERAMAELGYVYNRSAAGLRGSSTDLVGLVINDLRNPFFTEFAASAQMAFGRKGYSTVIANTDEDPETQRQVVTTMIEHGVSGIVISPTYGGGGGTFDGAERSGVPLLQVLRQVEDRTAVFPFASFDYAAGGALATEHLLALGCSEIAFVGGLADRAITLERMRGYSDRMKAAGLRPRHFPGRPSRAFGRETALRIARESPEIGGAVCFSDLVALGMLSGFAEAGVALGADFRLVGFDDIEESSLVYPALSSVRCDTKQFGEYAAEAILRWIVDGARPTATQRFPVELIERQSSLGHAPEAP